MITREFVLIITVVLLAFVICWLAPELVQAKRDLKDARTERDEARSEADQAWSGLVAAEAERQAAARFAAHWQAVAAGHPSADPHTFGRRAAHLVLTDDARKNRGGR